MANATYRTDLVDKVADSASTGNWSALGGGASGLNVETDYYIQGTRCISKNAWAGAEKGMIEDATLNTLSAGSGNAVYMWITHHTPGSLAVKASGGIQILLGSAANTYNSYYYAGSDTIDYGAPWICAVVDPDQGTQASGTVTTANIDCYGGIANLPTGGPTKGSPFGIDEIRYGRSIFVRDGVGGTAGSFTNIAVDNDNINNRWGQFQRTPGSATNFTMQCRLEFGDTTNTQSCIFTDSNKNITINDLEHVASSFIEFDVTQGSTVSLTSCNFAAASGANTRGNWVTTNATSVTIDSCSFANMGTFSFSSAVTVIDSVFRNCDTISPNAASISNSTIAVENGGVGIAASTSGALANLSGLTVQPSSTTDSNSIGIQYSGTTDVTLSGHTFTNLSGTNSRYAFEYTGGGTINITPASGCNITQAMVLNTSGTATVVAPALSLDVTNLRAGSEVRLFRQSDLVEVGTGIETVSVTDGTFPDGSTKYKASFTHSQGGTPVYVVVVALGYVPVKQEYTLPSIDGQSLLISQVKDRVYANPV